MSVNQISGLISGLDTATLIDALVAARSGPILHLQRRAAEKTAELTAWQAFDAVLVSLKIETERLGNRDLWDDLLVNPSDEDHITATAGKDSPLGQWEFHVEQLAVAHQIQSDAYSSTSDLIGSGTFSLTVGTITTDLTVAAGATVSDLVTQINDADIGVTAALLRSESGGTESFHLVITADDTGASSLFTTDSTGLSGGTAPDFTVNAPRVGADAIIEFGGEGGLQIHSSTNTFTNIVDGVDVTVTSTHDDGKSTQLKVERDTERLTARITEFVDRFNTVTSFKNNQFRFDQNLGRRPPLMGSAQLISITGDLRSKLLGPVGGLAGTSFSSMAGIGLTAGVNGALSFNESKFTKALEEDYEAVANLFRANATFDDTGVEWLTAPSSVDLGEKTFELVITQAAERGTLTGATIDFSGGIVIDDNNNSFQITIDGQKSEVITLANGTYTDGDSLAQALATAVANSEDLGALSVLVSFEEGAGSTGELIFSTTRFGSASSVQLHALAGSTFSADLGLTTVTGLRAAGQDVAGTINGIVATGNGSVLKIIDSEDLDDDERALAGLSFRVTRASTELPATVTATFTEGVGRKTSRLLRSLTDVAGGRLSRVENSIQGLLDRYARDIELKQEQLEIRRARLEAKFASLESTLSRFQNQGRFLSAQLDGLRSFNR